VLRKYKAQAQVWGGLFIRNRFVEIVFSFLESLLIWRLESSKPLFSIIPVYQHNPFRFHSFIHSTHPFFHFKIIKIPKKPKKSITLVPRFLNCSWDIKTGLKNTYKFYVILIHFMLVKYEHLFSVYIYIYIQPPYASIPLQK
jgi:hypothetical protein